MDEARAAEREAQGRLEACEEQLAAAQRDMHRMKSSKGSRDTKVRQSCALFAPGVSR